MNAEALIGMTLGTCSLQRLLGRGGMGAVFLAQQSRPPRQVALKVLFPATSLSQAQLAAFLERFRREMATSSLLEHPNIVPVFECGEQNGLPYIAMPYIESGTLRDLLTREGALPFPTIANYLAQIASALDYAHSHGIVHRDIKPANILCTADGRLLLGDFGLVKVLSDEQNNQPPLTGAGMPVGTPDYMSPEQVVGQPVDGRADLYSLGVIVYQMVTGMVPFVGETPMRVAAQHLQASPRSPRMLRVDLPAAAEQVMLRALAKRPEDRYSRAQDFALAFQEALASEGTAFEVSLSGPQSGMPEQTLGGGSALPRRSLFDPAWQQEAAPSAPIPSRPAPSAPAGPRLGHRVGLLRAAENAREAAAQAPQPTATGIFPPAFALNVPLTDQPATSVPQTAGQDFFSAFQSPATPDQMSPEPAVSDEAFESEDMPSSAQLPFPTGGPSPFVPGASPTRILPGGMTGAFPQMGMTGALPGGMTGAFPQMGMTGALPGGLTGSFSTTGMTGSLSSTTTAMKMVQIPVAGQPGRYVTGLLPVVQGNEKPAEDADKPGGFVRSLLRSPLKLIALILALVIVLTSVGVFLATRPHTNTATNTPHPQGPNINATATAQAQVTTDANVVISDPLSQNIHNWPISAKGGRIAFFKDNAYHLANTDNNNMAFAILQDVPPAALNGPLGYTLTMQEVKGDDGSINNRFGMIVRFNTIIKGGKTLPQFYALEVVNTKGGEYQFWKYDGSAGNHWTNLWHKGFGKEYHQGHGNGKENTMKIFASGSKFTFYINGKQIGMANDKSFTNGTPGMLINFDGTEVAFANLLVTHN